MPNGYMSSRITPYGKNISDFLQKQFLKDLFVIQAQIGHTYILNFPYSGTHLFYRAK